MRPVAGEGEVVVPRYVVELAGTVYEVEVRQRGEHEYTVIVDGREVVVDACAVEEYVCSLIVNGACHEVHYSQDRDRFNLLIAGEHYEPVARNRRSRAALQAGAGLVSGRQLISAPMPGRVVKLLVEVGQTVEPGQALLTLEAMKMENELRTPTAGTVSEIAAAEGDVVTTGQKLVVVE